MTKAATTEELASLHATVAQTLVEDLSAVDSKDEDVEVRVARIKMRHDARAHAIAFLKNNNITAAQDNAEMAALQKQLDEKRKQRKGAAPISGNALEEAAELYGQRLQ